MPERPLRLLIVGAFPPPGRPVFGGIVTLCRALLRSSLPVRAALTLIDTTQSSHPPPHALVRAWLALKRMLGYVVTLERNRPDAVILFVAAGMSVVDKGAMGWYARVRGVPALLYPCGGPVIDACQRSRVTRLWVRCAWAGARMILCQGQAWHRFAVDMMGFAPEAAPLIPNWTASPELLEVGSARAPRASVPRVLFVGWLDRTKGVAELLEACRQLAGRYRFTLYLCGEGNFSEAAREFVSAHHLGDFVHFCGWRSEEQLREQYAQADIFVLPSWSEGLPVALIEAMAAALAIVITPVGNILDAVEDGRSALLVPPRDPAALRGALERLLADAELRRTLGRAAHAVAAREFGVEMAVQRFIGAAERAQSPLRGAGSNPGADTGAS
jgi:glycosyltransferase involved in cell wall biosynthesis